MRITRVTTVLFLALSVGMLTGLLAPMGLGATVVGEDAELPPPEEVLDAARQLFPYDILEPAYLPPGMALFNVIFIVPEEEGETAHSIDMWFRGAAGETVHVWQTDHASLAEEEKDPTAEGAPVTLGGVQWSALILTDGPDGGQFLDLAARMEGGITVTVDGNVDPTELFRVAESLA